MARILHRSRQFTVRYTVQLTLRIPIEALPDAGQWWHLQQVAFFYCHKVSQVDRCLGINTLLIFSCPNKSSMFWALWGLECSIWGTWYSMQRTHWRYWCRWFSQHKDGQPHSHHTRKLFNCFFSIIHCFSLFSIRFHSFLFAFLPKKSEFKCIYWHVYMRVANWLPITIWYLSARKNGTASQGDGKTTKLSSNRFSFLWLMKCTC